MKVQNMTGNNGREVVKQFEIWADDGAHYFQSYNSIIVKITYEGRQKVVTLDEQTWDYSKTTGKYRNLFLDENKKTTEAKIKSGEYKLANLNK